MASTLTTTWPKEMDALLIECRDKGMCAEEIGEVLGKSAQAVRSRASRMGVKLVTATVKKRKARVANPRREGHRPFTDRCGELMRAAGVKI